MSNLDESLQQLESIEDPTLCGAEPCSFGPDKLHLDSLLALANCSAWSAEKISNKLAVVYFVRYDPPEVWEIFKKWAARREQGLVSIEAQKATDSSFRRILNDLGVEYNDSLKLNKTPRPVQVRHANIWYLEGCSTILFQNYTPSMRFNIQDHLTNHSNNNVLGRPTDVEQRIINHVGSAVAPLISRILQDWFKAVYALIPKTPFRTRHHDVKAICKTVPEHTAKFIALWEATHGIMDRDLGRYIIAPGGHLAMNVASTGAATERLVHMMLLDRLNILERRRLRWRQRTGFLQVSPCEVPSDQRDCPICKEPYGTQNEDGYIEKPMRMIACCGNYLGSCCLGLWFSRQPHGRSCPICRWRASELFVKKLFSVTWSEDVPLVEECDEEYYNPESEAGVAETGVVYMADRSVHLE